MKLILFIFITLLFVGCAGETPKPTAAPTWYTNQSLPVINKYDVVGYGQGTTLNEAQANAKEAIAQSMVSKVDSSFSSVATDEGSSSKSELKITSNLNLQNVQTLRQKQINGTFFVAMTYENLDLAYRVKTTLGDMQCSDESVNTYMRQTPLFNSILASTQCALDLRLNRRNGAWYLTYKESLFLLSDDEFEELYVSTSNNSFEFSSSKNVLMDGDSFFFTFNAKQEGYITLLDVYENGIVTLIQASTPIKDSLQIPSKESSNYFEAGTLKEGEDTHDLYVALFTEKPLEMSRFTYADEDLASSESAYKFNELIDLMSKHNYSSLLLRTKTKER